MYIIVQVQLRLASVQGYPSQGFCCNVGGYICTQFDTRYGLGFLMFI